MGNPETVIVYREQSLSRFALKAFLAAFFFAAFQVMVIAYAYDVISYRMSSVERLFVRYGQMSTPEMIERALEKLAGAESDMRPETKANIAKHIRTISERWRPFIEAAQGTPVTPGPAH